LWDSKLILLAAVVYAAELGNVWCFRTGPEGCLCQNPS